MTPGLRTCPPDLVLSTCRRRAPVALTGSEARDVTRAVAGLIRHTGENVIPAALRTNSQL